MRRWMPGGNSVLKWFQNSGGWSRKFHSAFSARVVHAVRQRRVVPPDDELETPFARHALAEADHLRQLVRGVDVDGRERNAAEKRLARQPHQHVRILADRP